MWTKWWLEEEEEFCRESVSCLLSDVTFEGPRCSKLGYLNYGYPGWGVCLDMVFILCGNLTRL